jgi:hypothetical protein
MVGLAALGAAAVIGLAALSALLTVIAAHGACSGPAGAAPPTSEARHSIPAAYLTLYEQAARVYGVPWPVLAAIGSIETDHGRSRAPGVRAGVNRHGCCAGPMQFNTRDGPPSTWERYGADANHDGTTNIYDPEDAIPAAANYLAALLRANGDNLSQAILGYNHSEAYLRDVLARARTYARLTRRPAHRTDRRDNRAGRLRRRERWSRQPARRPARDRAANVPQPAGLGHGRRRRFRRGRRAPLQRRRLDPAALPPSCDRRPRGRSPHPRRRHRRRPRPRRRQRAGSLGRLRGTPRPRPRLDPGVRALRHTPRLPARAGDPVPRLRRLPRPRLAAHLHRRLPAAPAPLLGLALLRHQQPLPALRLGDDVRRRYRWLRGSRAISPAVDSKAPRPTSMQASFGPMRRPSCRSG